MPTPEAHPTPVPANLAALHAARLDACWPQVHVESVQLTHGPLGEFVRALIQLGGLAPADVRVELLSPELPAETETARPGERRMCSSQSFGNGCVVFETTIPAGSTAEPREMTIHVHPSEALDEPRVEHRFRSEAH